MIVVMPLSNKQIEKLADFCLDLAKACFVAAIAGPAITSVFTFFTSVRYVIAGIGLVYMALSLFNERNTYDSS